MKTTLKLGLCCLRAAKDAPRMRTITRKKYNTLSPREANLCLLDIFSHNILTTQQNIQFCAENDIQHYRISSSLFPLVTLFGDRLADALPNDSNGLELMLENTGKIARRLGVSLSTHPDQYCVLGSPNPDVRQRSIREFNFQAYVMKHIGPDIPMCLHVSNGSQPPADTHERFMNSFKKLSPYAQSNICLENEDKGCWTPDMLWEYFDGFKLVYDTLHHAVNPGTFSPASAVKLFKTRWESYEGPTTFHWSEGVTSDSRSHADYFSQFPEIVCDNPDVVWECEVKAKELAILQALEDFS